MEIKGKVDANSSYLQTLNGSMKMSDYEQRRSDIIAGSSNSNMDELIWREMEKKKIREEILRRELEKEALEELVLEGKISMPRPERFVLGSDTVFNHQNELGFGSSSSLALDGAKFSRIERRLQMSNESGANLKPIIFQKNNDPGKQLSSNADTVSLKRKNETSNSDETCLVNMTEKKSRRNWCDLCGVGASSEGNLQLHLNGRKHIKKEAALRKSCIKSSDSNSYVEETKEFAEVASVTTNSSSDMAESFKLWCSVCHVGVTSEMQMDEHRNGSKHMKRIKDSSSDVAESFKLWCSVCHVGATSELQMDAHRNGSKHMKRIKERGGGVIAIKTTPDAVCDDNMKS